MSLIFILWFLLFGLIPHSFQCAAFEIHFPPLPSPTAGSTNVTASNTTSSSSSDSKSSPEPTQDSPPSTDSSVTTSSSVTTDSSQNLSPSPTPPDSQTSSEDTTPTTTPPDSPGSASTDVASSDTAAANPPDPSSSPSALGPSPTDKHVTPSSSTADLTQPPNLVPSSASSINQTLPPSSVTTTASSASQTPAIAGSKSSSHAGPIAGGVVGGIILLLIIASIILRFRRGRERLDPYILDVPSHTVDDTPNSQSRLFAENPLPTDPFGAAPLQASYGQSSLMPPLPITAEEKMQQQYSGQLSIISTTTSAAGPDELIPIHAMSSDQLDVVRILLKRNVPAETISRVVGRMMANQAGSNTMEGHDLIQMEPSMEPSLEYPATPRWL